MDSSRRIREMAREGVGVWLKMEIRMGYTLDERGQ
jgi:hypothetical protein